MTSNRPLWTVLVIVFLASLCGFIWWMQSRDYQTTDDAFIDVHMVRVAPQVAGRVISVPANDNQDVKVGDLLLEIDPAEYQSRLDQDLANEASSKGELAQAQAQLVSARANVEQAQSEIDLAAANASNAINQFNRNQQLAQKKIVSQQQLDDSIANSKSNNANLEAARRKKTYAEAQVAVSESHIISAEAGLKSVNAQVEQAKLNLSYTKLLAPQDGHITQKAVTAGDYIQVGQNVMLIVPKNVWVTANFKETQLDDIRVGQSVDIKIDAYPEHIFIGHVDSIVRGGGAAFSLLPPENATGNYIKVVQRVPVKIVFDEPIDPQYNLGPSMSVVPSIHVR